MSKPIEYLFTVTIANSIYFVYQKGSEWVMTLSDNAEYIYEADFQWISFNSHNLKNLIILSKSQVVEKQEGGV